jgi:hypothetical protein
MLNAVTVTSTNINDHTQKSEVMFLRRHWSVNARKPLSTTLGKALTIALSQRILSNVQIAA